MYGLRDPNPQVAGRGAAKVKAAGIRVEQWQGNGAEALSQLIEVFRCNMEERRPFFALKAATTLDGCLAEISGKSQWITGEESRREVHRLRSIYDAVMVGGQTVLTDNPRLNLRLVDGVRENKVVILDPKNTLGEGDEIFGFVLMSTGFKLDSGHWCQL